MSGDSIQLCTFKMCIHVHTHREAPLLLPHDYHPNKATEGRGRGQSEEQKAKEWMNEVGVVETRRKGNVGIVGWGRREWKKGWRCYLLVMCGRHTAQQYTCFVVAGRWECHLLFATQQHTQSSSPLHFGSASRPTPTATFNYLGLYMVHEAHVHTPPVAPRYTHHI